MSNAWGRNVLVLAFTTSCMIAVAQEKTREKPLGGKGNSELKVTSDSRETVKGRLPRYFASLVNSDQRMEIYLIQAKFRDQISELKLFLLNKKAQFIISFCSFWILQKFLWVVLTI